MELPYILVEIPAGKIADLFMGEKELLAAGNLIMVFAMIIIFLISEANVFLWAGVLFFSRIGGALYEAMSESGFFKNISSKDADIINLYRVSNPAGWLVGSAISALSLKYYPLPYVFIALAIVLLLNFAIIAGVKDTK